VCMKMLLSANRASLSKEDFIAQSSTTHLESIFAAIVALERVAG